MASEPVAPTEDAVRSRIEAARDPQALLVRMREILGAHSAFALEVRHVQVMRVYYKPFERGRLVLQLTVRDTRSGQDLRQHVSLQIYPELADARRRLRDYLEKPSLPSIGPPAFVVEDWHAIGYSLPNGPRLRRLAYFFDPPRIGGLLERRGLLPGGSSAFHPNDMELLRYVPRKRALLRYTRPDTKERLYIKLYAVDGFALALHNMRAVRKATRRQKLQFRLPMLLARSRKRRALIMAELAGRELTGMYAELAPALARRVGNVLGRLHAARLPLEAHWRAQDELVLANRAAEDLKQAVPAIAPETDRLLALLDEQLATAESFQAVPIHANLFGDQILVDGEEIGIVDWDDLAGGDPCFDMGRLLAHVHYECLTGQAGRVRTDSISESFLAGHRDRLGEALSESRLNWHVATALLMRAKISALRMLSPEWPQRVAVSVRHALACLERGRSASDGPSQAA